MSKDRHIEGRYTRLVSVSESKDNDEIVGEDEGEGEGEGECEYMMLKVSYYTVLCKCLACVLVKSGRFFGSFFRHFYFRRYSGESNTSI